MQGLVRGWVRLVSSLIVFLGMTSALPGQEPVRATEPETPVLLENALRYWDSHQEEKALDLFLRVLDKSPDNLKALNGAAYLYGEVGKLFREKKKKKTYFNQSFQLAQRAYQLAPRDSETNLTMAWALGGIALISGGRSKVKAARDLKMHLDVAMEGNPDDARAWYLLANWNFEVANANFFERAAARVLFGGVPQGVTKEKAIEAYRKAVELAPDRILYRYELALALKKTGKNPQALAELEQIVSRTPVRKEDPQILQKSRSLIRRLEKR